MEGKGGGGDKYVKTFTVKTDGFLLQMCNELLNV